MPQIPEGTGHRSQRDMINSCFHAQWPWPGPCGEEPLYHRHHTHVWAKQDDFAIHLQGPQGGRKTTVRRSNARRDVPRQVGFAHRKRDIVPSLRVHALSAALHNGVMKVAHFKKSETPQPVSNLSLNFLRQKHYDHINPSSTKSHFQLKATYKKRRNFHILKKAKSPCNFISPCCITLLISP